MVELQHKRNAVNKRITRLSEFIDNFDKSAGDYFQLSDRFEKLDLCYSEFDSIQFKIEMLDENDTDYGDTTRTDFENTFCFKV